VHLNRRVTLHQSAKIFNATRKALIEGGTEYRTDHFNLISFARGRQH